MWKPLASAVQPGWQPIQRAATTIPCRIWLNSYGLLPTNQRYLPSSELCRGFVWFCHYLRGSFGRVGLAGSRETPRLLVGRAPSRPQFKKGVSDPWNSRIPTYHMWMDWSSVYSSCVSYIMRPVPSRDFEGLSFSKRPNRDTRTIHCRAARAKNKTRRAKASFDLYNDDNGPGRNHLLYSTRAFFLTYD